MKHPQDVDSSSDDGQGPLKPSIPSPSPSESPSHVCTPSAHLSMPHHTLSEHPDPTPSGSAAIPTHNPDSPGSPPFFLSSPPSFLIEFPTSLRPLCDSPSQDDHALSNLPGPSVPFDAACPNDVPASLTDKGKAKEPPPTLPPLSLSPSDLGYNIDDWSSTAGPSSSRSTCASLRTAFSSHSPPSSIESTVVHADEPPILTKVPSRTRSLSNLSVRSTTPPMSKIRIKLAAPSKGPGNLARRLLSRNKTDAAGPSVTGPAGGFADPLGDDLMPIEAGNCLFPWQAKDITRASTPRGAIGVETQVAPIAVPDVAPVWYSDSHYLDEVVFPRSKKGHSYSSPYPKSAFDVVPQVDFEDKFIHLPFYARDLFDEKLPRELRIRVLSELISLHEADHEQLKNTGKWSVLAASSSKNRWVGRNRAMRELVKLSRVGIVDSCPVDQVNQS